MDENSDRQTNRQADRKIEKQKITATKKGTGEKIDGQIKRKKEKEK